MDGDGKDDIRRTFDLPKYTRARRRRRLKAAVVAGAVAVVVAVAVRLAVWPPHDDPGDHASAAPCAEDPTGQVLRADVDGDGRTDRVEDGADRAGQPRVSFAGGGSVSAISTVLTPWQKARVHATPAEETRATFGDFDGDGHVDLAVFSAAPDEGDDPQDTMTVHETHWGPLGRDLRGRRTTTVHMPYKHWIAGVRGVDREPGNAAELRVYQSAGDGMVEEYKSRIEGRSITVSADPTQSSNWPHQQAGWADFGVCGD